MTSLTNTEGQTLEITPLERDVIQAFLDSDYCSRGVDSTPWSWSITNGDRRYAGALGSLCAKGVLTVWDYEGKGRNEDQVCNICDGWKLSVAAEFGIA